MLAQRSMMINGANGCVCVCVCMVSTWNIYTNEHYACLNELFNCAFPIRCIIRRTRLLFLSILFFTFFFRLAFQFWRALRFCSFILVTAYIAPGNGTQKAERKESESCEKCVPRIRTNDDWCSVNVYESWKSKRKFASIENRRVSASAVALLRLQVCRAGTLAYDVCTYSSWVEDVVVSCCELGQTKV